MEVKINNNINEKIIEQLKSVLVELKKAKDNTYSFGSLARANICKAEGVLETIKLLLE